MRAGRPWIIISLLLAMSLTCTAPIRAASADLQALGQGGAGFTLNLYHQMLAKEKGNIFFSPYSISLALSLVLAGAKGETAQEMARALGLNLPPERLHPAMGELVRHLTKVGNEAGQTLSVANAAWLSQGMKLLPDYQSLIKDKYSSEINQVDFCQGEQARQTINGWVSRKTKDRIKDLIPSGLLNCDTMMVLTNAIYFLGEWAEKFDAKQTKPEPFWASPDKKVETPFMHRTGEYLYAEAEGWQVLELPYRENRLAMVVLLPKTKGGLAEVEKGLTVANLEKSSKDLAPRKVQVSLPKFEVKAAYGLNEYLIAAGMKRAFSPIADFSGIAAQQKMKIDAVLHKAWVKVEEKGTEAAAATAVVMTKAAAPVAPKPVTFKADHPFLFLIKDKETGLILFWGRLANPKAG
jgi:serpin B